MQNDLNFENHDTILRKCLCNFIFYFIHNMKYYSARSVNIRENSMKAVNTNGKYHLLTFHMSTKGSRIVGARQCE